MPDDIPARLLNSRRLREDFLQERARQLPLFKRLLAENLGASDEQVLIISDHGTEGARTSPRLNALYAAAAEELGLQCRLVAQGVKLRGDVASPEVVKALSSLPRGSLILLNISGRIGNLSELGLSYRTFCRERQHRFFSSSNLGLIPDASFGDILDAMDIDYGRLSREGAALKRRLDAAEEMRVTTAAGSDFTVRIAEKTAINNDGRYREPGRGGNMPAGEVYVPPTKRGVEGRIVIDGSYRTKDSSLVPHEPIVLEVEKGDIVRMNATSEAKALERTLAWAERRAKHPWGIRRICELGIGLNPKAKLVGCTILDEKVRGTVHIANGSNKWFGGDVAAIIHLDHVLKKPTVWADGERLDLPKP